MTKTILFTIRKGGVGKTTLATNQACLFAKKGKTLLIDLDPQANVIAQFGFNPITDKNKTILDLVDTDCKLQDVLYTSQQLGVVNLNILASNYLLADFFESKAKNPYARILNTISKIIKTNEFDYIVIDTNPAWNDLISWLVQKSDMTIIPYNPEPNSHFAMKDFWECLLTIRDLNVKTKIVVVPNRFNIKKRKGVIIEDRSYQYLQQLNKDAIDDKLVFIAETISPSEQYANSVAFDKKPLTAVDGMKVYAKPKKQQIELNEFILEKL